MNKDIMLSICGIALIGLGTLCYILSSKLENGCIIGEISDLAEYNRVLTPEELSIMYKKDHRCFSEDDKTMCIKLKDPRK